MAPRVDRQQLTQAVINRNLTKLFLENATFRYFLWTLLRDAGIFYPAFTRGSPIDTAYEAGRQSLGLEVLHQLKNLTPGVLGLLEREGDLFTQRQQEQEDAAPTPDFTTEDPDEF